MSENPSQLKIDYEIVTTRKVLFAWACREFNLPDKEIDDSEEFLMLLFSTLAERGKNYEVTEYNSNKITPEVDRCINGYAGIEGGWKQALGFFLSRKGNGACVIFKNSSWW
jgi:hypothetical protein